MRYFIEKAVCFSLALSFLLAITSLKAQEWPWNVEHCQDQMQIVQICCPTDCPTQHPYVMVYREEFLDDNLDLAYWESRHWGNAGFLGEDSKGLDFFTLDNFHTENGYGIITEKNEPIWGKAVEYYGADETIGPPDHPDWDVENDWGPNWRYFEWQGANIWGKRTFHHGRYSIRCKVPKGDGHWPAFWLYGDQAEEIDIFEFEPEYNAQEVWQEGKSNETHHFSLHSKNNVDGTHQRCSQSYRNADLGDGFHTYTLEWSPQELRLYVDDVFTYRVTRYMTIGGSQINCENIPTLTPVIKNRAMAWNPLRMIFNTGMSPSFGVTTADPFAYMEIDYITFEAPDLCHGARQINSQSVIDLYSHPEEYNYYQGTTVEIFNGTGSGTIDFHTQFRVIGRDEINIGGGVDITADGVDFILEPDVCFGRSMSGSSDEDRDFEEEEGRRIAEFERTGIREVADNPYKEESVPSKIKTERKTLVLYPNPSSDRITINSVTGERLKTCEIWNVTGSIIQSIDMISNETGEIDVSSLAVGLYSVRVITDSDRIEVLTFSKSQ